MGFTRSLHVLTRTTAGAIADFRRWEGTREVWADLDGHFRLSQRRLHRRVRILGIENVSTLIVLDPESHTIHTVGPNETANVYPSGIVAQPGRPVTVETRPVTLTQRLLRELLREVPPDGETYFHGIVRTPDAVALKPDPEAYEVLKAGLSELELRFARPRDLEDPKVGSVFVLSGLVLVQTIRPADATPTPPSAAPLAAPEFDDVTELFIAHLTDPARELLVREGDRVQRGQLLARLTWQDPETRAEAPAGDRGAGRASRAPAVAGERHRAGARACRRGTGGPRQPRQGGDRSPGGSRGRGTGPARARAAQRRRAAAHRGPRSRRRPGALGAGPRDPRQRGDRRASVAVPEDHRAAEGVGRVGVPRAS